MPSSESAHRVYYLTELDRKNLTAKRATSAGTNAAVIDGALTAQLPKIVDALTQLGFAPASATRPARLPLTAEALASLRVAAEATGVAQSQLLLLSLRAHCADAASEAPAATTEPPETPEAPKSRTRAKPQGKAKETSRKAASATAPKEAAPKVPRRSGKKGGGK